MKDRYFIQEIHTGIPADTICATVRWQVSAGVARGVMHLPRHQHGLISATHIKLCCTGEAGCKHGKAGWGKVAGGGGGDGEGLEDCKHGQARGLSRALVCQNGRG